MGRLKLEEPALEEPLGAGCSGALRVVSFGTELVVETLAMPGWRDDSWPVARLRLWEPFLTVDRGV